MHGAALGEIAVPDWEIADMILLCLLKSKAG